MYNSYEQRMNDFHKKPRKGFHKSVLDKYKDYQSDTKISVNKTEPEIEEIDEERRDEQE